MSVSECLWLSVYDWECVVEWMVVIYVSEWVCLCESVYVDLVCESEYMWVSMCESECLGLIVCEMKWLYVSEFE